MAQHEVPGDVAIVGAGLIGLAIAFELSELGITVRVYERGEPGRAASWAGAGMLAPYTESIHDDAMLAFCLRSLAAYPRFTQRIREASGVDARLHLDGILTVACDEAKLAELQTRADALRSLGVAHRLLERRDVIEREPALGTHVLGGLVVEGEGYVDNRRLGRALRAACETRGVIVIADARSVAVECDDRRVLGVRSHRGFTPADVVINAAGAWAGAIEGVPQWCAPPVEPLKGQMLALAVPRGFVRATTWVPGAYFVPRDDGRLLIGATVEHAGFDERVTARGLRKLLGAALEAAPSLADFTVSETWAGLRPRTPDGRPCLGPTPMAGMIVATGHLRNGILLAPETARVIATYVASGDATALQPFALARFGTEGATAART